MPNVAPEGGSPTRTVEEDGSYTFTVTDFGLSDSDGHALLSVIISTLPDPAKGTLRLAGVLVTAGQEIDAPLISQLVFMPTANSSGEGNGNFSFQVRDDGPSEQENGDENLDVSPNIFTIDVTAANDAPVVAIGALGHAAEQQALNIKGKFSLSDTDGGTGVVTATLSVGYGILTLTEGNSGASVTGSGSSVTITGTLAQIEALLGSDPTSTVTFTPDTDSPPASTQLTLSIDDGSGADAVGSATATIAITEINDAPTITGMAGDAVTYSEGASLVRLDLGGDAALLDHDTNGFQIRAVGTFSAPVFVAPVPDGSGRVFVVERAGRILLLDPATGNKSLFLDIRSQVADLNGERGLVGFTTAPDFETSGKFYVFLSDRFGNNQVRSYTVSAGNPDVADPNSADVILSIAQPEVNIHNGGWLGFGPDGFLYVTTGDGSYGGEYRDANSIHGKILRLDVSQDAFQDDPLRDYAIPTDNPFVSGGGLAEAFAMGFRNPYRASFDPETGKLFVADVGQAFWEEVNVITPAQAGANYGWNFWEGTHPYRGGYESAENEVPALEYGHGPGLFEGSSVTGGYVYRGPIQSLQGKYIFGDFITGNIWAVDVTKMVPGTTLTTSDFQPLKTALSPLVGPSPLISSFGVDQSGNLYIVDLRGTVYTMEAASGANFGGGRLTVSITANEVAGEDLLLIDTAADTTITLSSGTNVGSQVRVGGILVGTIASSGSGGADLIIDLSSGATEARLKILLSAVAYSNSNTVDPTTGTRTVTYTLVDGAGTANGGQDTLAFTSFVTVTASNDAPTGTATTATITEEGSHVFSVADFGFADAEGNALLGVKISSLPLAGQLTLDGSAVLAVAVISVSDLQAGKLVYAPAPNGSGQNYASLTFQVQDDGGTANNGVDLDGTPRAFVFNVTPVNDAPALQLSADPLGASLAYGENDAASPIAPNAQLTDLDSPDLGGGTLTVSLDLNGTAEDHLGIQNEGTGPSQIGVSGANVTFGGVVIGSFAGGANGTNLVVTLNTNSTPAAVQALVRSITYSNESDAPSTLQRTVSFTLSDGDGGTAQATAAVNVTEQNDAPSGTNFRLAVSEDGSVQLLEQNFDFTDVESDALAGVVITSLPTSGVLLLGGSAVVSGQFVPLSALTAGTLTFSPAADANGTGQASFTYQARDVRGGTDPSANTVTFDVAAVNDAPVLAVPTQATISYTENAAATPLMQGVILTDVDAPSSYSGGSISISLGGSEGGINLRAGTAFRVIGNSDGTFSLAIQDGATQIPLGTVTGMGTTAVTITGLTAQATLSRLNDLIDDFTFLVLGDAPLAGNRTVTLTVNDGANVNGGVALAASRTQTLQVIALDDPAVARDDFFGTDEGTVVSGNLVANNGPGADSDVDGPAITIAAVNGSATNVDAQITLASGALLTVQANGTYIYDPNDAFEHVPGGGAGGRNPTQSDSFSYTLVGGGIANVTIVISGLDNDDRITGSSGNDELHGGRGDDSVAGGSGNDGLFGGDGNDSIEGGAGTDILVGGSGNDALFGGADADELFGQEGNDTLVGDDGNDNLHGGDGADTLVGGTGQDSLFGGEGGDGLHGQDGDDVLFGEGGDDNLHGGAGRDILVGGLGSDSLFGGADDDDLHGQEGGDNLFGEAGNDNLHGGAGADVLVGGIGADGLFGGADADELSGQEGNDTLFGEEGDDDLQGGAGTDILVGGAGNDRLLGGADSDDLFGEDGDDALSGDDGDDNLNGGHGRDVLSGGAGLDRLLGGDDADELHGGLGEDFLAGESGNDGLFGGDGEDDLGGGTGADILVGGSGNDRLFGGADADELFGQEGNDTLFGEAGDDNLHGGAGRDILVGGAGKDGLFGGADDDDLHGQDGDDVLFGEDGNDNLHGGVGRDILVGGGGNDGLVGGAEADELFGQEGDDSLSGESGDDNLHGGAGRDILVGGVGNDGLFGGADADEMFGQEGDDTLSGEDGNDNLHGGAGRDILVGGAGNDALFGGDDDDDLHGQEGDDILFGEAGSDTVHGGIGNDTLVGGEGDDQLLGQEGNDYIDGGSGADYLFGGLGLDVLIGGAGNDTFVFTAVAESTSAARDQVYSFGAGDKIDLSAFDAKSGTAARDSFTFIGSSEFTKVAGQLRIYQQDALWMVDGDVDGDGAADLSIQVNTDAGYALTSSDVLGISGSVSSSPAIYEKAPEQGFTEVDDISTAPASIGDSVDTALDWGGSNDMLSENDIFLPTGAHDFSLPSNEFIL